MKTIKYCIFHIPNHIPEKSVSGSYVRPKKMLQALMENGYEVDYVMGFGKERKNQIQEIEKKILNGRKYDFIYSESSTMPTLLTESHHLPTYGAMDFKFFQFCKEHGIKIGLFYRDIYWKFPIYKKNVSWLKRIFAISMYQYDLKKYEKLVTRLYLPSEKMKKYVGIQANYDELPPGSECGQLMSQPADISYNIEKDDIDLFYVGGVGDLYDLTKLLKGIAELSFVNLTICARENEWEERKDYYLPYLSDRVKVVHESGKALQKYYASSDICMLFFESEEYRKFAMPIKLFEYLASMKPIIATDDTAAGVFIEKNNIGWSICHEEKELEQLLKEIHDNKKLLNGKKENMKEALEKNTWNARAQKVIRDLA